MFSKSISTFAVLILLVCFGSGIAAQLYQVTDIGAPYVYAKGLNESSQVVGYVKPNGSWSQAHAFLWEIETGLTLLGGYAAQAINDLGQIAGNSAMLQAAVWENGEWVILEGRQEAVAINNNGQVTGLISAQGSIPGNYAPYRDDDIHSPGFIELATPYTRASHGYDINNKGQIVADCGAPPLKYVGVFYDSHGAYTILDNGGNYDTHAMAINDLGQIVGDTQIELFADHYAVFWNSPDSGLEYMGSLGSGYGAAYAINNFGQAVGSSAGRAFIWTSDDGMRDLNNLIDPNLGITLTWATDIADSGSIVAWGLDSLGREHSYLLTPPQPWTIDVDIRPGACPNPLNLNSRGLLPVAILGSEDFDATTIDIASVRLAGVAPIRSTFEDVAAPASNLTACDCTTAGADGYTDLMLKFRTHELVQKLLRTRDELVRGRVLQLTLTAVLSDDTRVRGADCVIIRGKAPRNLRAKMADIDGDGLVNLRDLAMIAGNWLKRTDSE